MRHRKATLAGGFKETFFSPDKFLLSEYILSTETPPSFRLTMTNCSLSLSGLFNKNEEVFFHFNNKIDII